MGKHDADLYLPDQLEETIKWQWLQSTPGELVSILARISITFTLVHLFGVRQWFKWFTITITGMFTLLGLALVICTWLEYTPATGLWTIYNETGTHWDPSILTDLEYSAQCEFLNTISMSSTSTLSPFYFYLFSSQPLDGRKVEAWKTLTSHRY